jgi:hypothetical protein
LSESSDNNSDSETEAGKQEYASSKPTALLPRQKSRGIIASSERIRRASLLVETSPKQVDRHERGSSSSSSSISSSEGARNYTSKPYNSGSGGSDVPEIGINKIKQDESELGDSNTITESNRTKHIEQHTAVSAPPQGFVGPKPLRILCQEALQSHPSIDQATKLVLGNIRAHCSKSFAAFTLRQFQQIRSTESQTARLLQQELLEMQHDQNVLMDEVERLGSDSVIQSMEMRINELEAQLCEKETLIQAYHVRTRELQNKLSQIENRQWLSSETSFLGPNPSEEGILWEGWDNQAA